MKKMAAAWMVGLVLVISGCGNKTDSVKEIQKAGVLKTAIVNSENQYTSLSGNSLEGLEPELVNWIASSLGVQPDYQIVSREEALAAVSDGSADIAIGCFDASGGFSESYLYTTAYGKGFFYVVTKRGDYAHSAGDLADSRIGAQADLNASIQTRLSAANGISFYETADTAWNEIKSGTIRAYVCGEEQAKQALSDAALQVQNLFYADPAQYVIVAGKEDQKLVSGMNTLITQFLTKEE